MRDLFYIITFLTLLSCSFENKPEIPNSNIDSLKTDKQSQDKVDKKSIQYTEKQLETFLDSVGKLPTNPLIDKVSFMSDSIFENQTELDKKISSSDFDKLKRAIKSNEIDFKTATRIFGYIDSGFIEDGIIHITCYSFDQNRNDFHEFAIILGYPESGWSCEIYFFSSDNMISKNTVFHKYGLELEHFQDTDGKTVIYYKENYESGSGIWWFNYYFYKYHNGKLIPVLNELQNANLSPYWHIRGLWLETFVQKTNPLTLKMVYRQYFPDSITNQTFVDDSTLIEYIWDKKSKTLIGNYKKSKISKEQILSYYLEYDEILFMNAYYETLKATLHDKKMRIHTLNYLNEVKNHYDNK